MEDVRIEYNGRFKNEIGRQSSLPDFALGIYRKVNANSDKKVVLPKCLAANYLSTSGNSVVCIAQTV